MMKAMQVAALCALVLGVAAVGAAVAGSPTVRVTTSYCPSLFSGKGSVVSVDPSANGAFEIVSKDWKWPDSGGVGCPENETPNILAAANGMMYLDFGTDWGLIVAIDAANSGNVTQSIKATTGQLAFDGFTAFVQAGDEFKGLTPQAAQHGFCSDGCFQFGAEDIKTGRYDGYNLIPYKAVMTNVNYLDEATNTYYIQGSYPLNDSWACSQDQTDECLIAIDAATGAMKSAKGPNAYTMYGIHNAPVAADGTVLAWVFGFQDKCKHPDPLNDFAFARVNLATGAATLVACMSKEVSINTNPNTGAFSPDGSLFATGSGNSETGEVQLVVLDTATGAKVLDSQLPGLKKALHVSTQAPFINVWGISWA